MAEAKRGDNKLSVVRFSTEVVAPAMFTWTNVQREVNNKVSADVRSHSKLTSSSYLRLFTKV